MSQGLFDAPSKSVANESPAPRSPVWHEIVMDHPQAIVLVDDEGHVRFANHAAHALFGQPAGELYGSMLPPPLKDAGETRIGLLRPDRKPQTVDVRQEVVMWDGRALTALLLEESSLEDEDDRIGPVLFDEEMEGLVPDPLDFEDAPPMVGEHVLTDPLDQLLGTRRTRLKLPRTHHTYISRGPRRRKGP